MRLPADPPVGTDPLDIALHYLDFYVQEYARARAVVKGRASRVVIGTAGANGLIALLGALIAVMNAPWLGVVSAGLAGFVSVIVAWDGMFRHRDLWVQRTMMLAQLQALKRVTELRRASGDDRQTLAQTCMQQLNEILNEDLSTWAELRRSPTSDRNVDVVSGGAANPNGTAT
ncbi:hypothetical protein Lfu02_31540 [Longispora fulva]|nr:hypothetical protein Lfu02_31540 [Longispora fulva]